MKTETTCRYENGRYRLGVVHKAGRPTVVLEINEKTLSTPEGVCKVIERLVCLGQQIGRQDLQLEFTALLNVDWRRLGNLEPM